MPSPFEQFTSHWAQLHEPTWLALVGQAGMGKTWLFQAFRQHLERQEAVLPGLLEAGAPFLPRLLRSGFHLLSDERDPEFLGAARWVAPDQAWALVVRRDQPLDAERQIWAIARALDRLAQRFGRLLLLLEDLHLWPEDDLHALRLLWQRLKLAKSPVLLVSSSWPNLSDWLEESQPAPQLVFLQPLDAARTRSMLEGILGGSGGSVASDLLDWLLLRSEGHPLHCVELLRFLISGGALEGSVFRPPPDHQIPQGLQRVLQLRLEAFKVEPDLWLALSALAGLGRELDFDGWRQICGFWPEQLQALISRGLGLGALRVRLERGGEAFSLPHPMYAPLILGMLGSEVQKALFFKIVQGLTEPVERANLARRCGHPQALAWTLEALDSAQSRFAFSEVVRQAEALQGQALERWDEVHFWHGQALYHLARTAAAALVLSKSHLSEALELRIEALENLGRYDEAFALIHQALAGSDVQMQFRLLQREVFVLAQQGQVVEASLKLNHLPASVNLQDQAQTLLLQAHLALIHNQFDQVLVFADQATDLLRGVGRSEHLAAALGYAGFAHTRLGNVLEAQTCLQESIDLLQLTGKVLRTQGPHYNLAFLRFAQGRYEEASRIFRQELQLHEAGSRPAMLSLTLASLGIVELALGHLPEAQQICERVEMTLGPIEHQSKPETLLLAAYLQALMGKPEKGLALLEHVQDGQRPQNYFAFALLIYLVAGKLEQAAAVISDSPAFLPQLITEHLRRTYTGIFHAITGNPAQARAVFEQARQIPLNAFFVAENDLLEACVLLQTGEPEVGKKRGQAALSVLSEQDAIGHLLTAKRFFGPAFEQLDRLHQAQTLEPQAASTDTFLRTLGGLELETAGLVMPWRSTKVRELLALLVTAYISPDGPAVARNSLIAVLWPMTNEDRGESSFRTTLSRLRESLAGSARISRTSSGQYQLEALRSDVTLFLEALERLDLDAAAAWYRGPYLPQIDLEPVNLMREHLHQSWRKTVLQLAQEGPAQRSIEAYERLHHDDPLDLYVITNLMRLLHEQQQTGKVRSLLNQCRQRFEREFGEIPLELLDA